VKISQSRTFTASDYLALNHVFAGGDISGCSKADLERFATMLSRPNASTHFGASSFPQICETVRTLLIVRMSEEQNKQAGRISRIALYVSVVAVLASSVQAGVAVWQFFVNKIVMLNLAVNLACAGGSHFYYASIFLPSS
jgi:hypothetical protein